MGPRAGAGGGGGSCAKSPLTANAATSPHDFPRTRGARVLNFDIFHDLGHFRGFANFPVPLLLFLYCQVPPRFFEYSRMIEIFLV